MEQTPSHVYFSASGMRVTERDVVLADWQFPVKDIRKVSVRRVVTRAFLVYSWLVGLSVASLLSLVFVLLMLIGGDTFTLASNGSCIAFLVVPIAAFYTWAHPEAITVVGSFILGLVGWDFAIVALGQPGTVLVTDPTIGNKVIAATFLVFALAAFSIYRLLAEESKTRFSVRLSGAFGNIETLSGFDEGLVTTAVKAIKRAIGSKEE